MQLAAGQDRARSTGLHKRAQGSSVDRPVNRSRRSVDRSINQLACRSLCWSRSTGPVNRGTGLTGRPVDRQARLLLLNGSDSFSISGSNRVMVF